MLNSRAVVVSSLIVCLALVAGCVERELTITSEPAGALVYFADEEIGRTPMTVPFTWYGDYEVILRLAGYQTLHTHTNINPPIYDIWPWDLVSQTMVPWTYHCRVERHYQLDPLTLPPDEELRHRADQLRTRAFTPVDD